MRQIVKTLFVEATPEVVWGFLTEKDKIGLWFNTAETGMTEGEDWGMQTGGGVKMWGHVLEAKAPERLVATFNHDWLNHDTTIRWDLVARDGGTQLTLTHDGWEGCEGDIDKLVADHDEGWGKHMSTLQSLSQKVAA